jgi:hypothetical protein
MDLAKVKREAGTMHTSLKLHHLHGGTGQRLDVTGLSRASVQIHAPFPVEFPLAKRVGTECRACPVDW